MLKNISIQLRKLCPIKKGEFLKFFLTSFFIFCALMIQNIVRMTKDALINTLVGTEIVVFLKSFIVLPLSIIFTVLYLKILDIIRAETIFLIVVSIFSVFFILFGLIIFPNYELLHLNNESQQFLINKFPHFKWFILLFSNWSFSLFYLFAELWPNIILALLVWQLINTISTVAESKKFYPLFGLISHTSLIFSGSFFSKIRNFIPEGANLNLFFLKAISYIIFFFGILLIIMFKILSHKFLQKKTLNFTIKKMEKFSFKGIFKTLKHQKYIRYITLVLICYGLSINLVEAPWKSYLSEIFTTPLDFGENYGKYMQLTGAITAVMVILSYIVIKNFGWHIAALLTPITMLTSGIVFFTSYVLNKHNIFLNISCLALQSSNFIIIAGAIQNISTKTVKYTFFDTTKEMSYVPLPYHIKTKGKAVADVTGTKIGKSLSSFLQSIIFIIFPNSTYATTSPFLMILFILVIITWIIILTKLNREYKILIEK
ncbi:MAG: ADP/ATP carrier protein [Rickettsia sp.]|nr:ADP/ATP carrier protein [Rickettsia sp.]